MEINADQKLHWTICPECHGQGKVLRRASRKRYRLFRIALEKYKAGESTSAPEPLKENLDICLNCVGSGLLISENPVAVDGKKYPTIAIVGGGIGGVALAVACLHRGIPFTLYERDASFDARSQGYGLTLQQASNAIRGLGIFSIDGGITSTRHVVHTPDGKVIGEWGLRKWKTIFKGKTLKRRNVHIARQSLRLQLLQQLGTNELIQWGHKLIDLSNNQDGTVALTFQVGEKQETVQADLIVGTDGIRSRVRELVIGEEKTPLRYLSCIVILGICPLHALSDVQSDLLDSATVFQTVNGHDRIYMMPYDADTIMWQASFPLSELEAKELSAQGAGSMKAEVCRRFAWHQPIPQILQATVESQITGYPVYDRELFDPTFLQDKGSVTLLGDAAHPMSPFKGQGANQALLDALMLARKIRVECDKNLNWREVGLRKLVLNDFEKEMAERSASKVEDSAKAVQVLHSKAVLHEGDAPRGRGLNVESE